jgi:hypothetical protein
MFGEIACEGCQGAVQVSAVLVFAEVVVRIFPPNLKPGGAFDLSMSYNNRDTMLRSRRKHPNKFRPPDIAHVNT